MLNARDYLGQTALMLAADQKDAELLQILIQRHVDLDAQDTLGRTALHSAVRANAGDCFKSLIDAGADPSLTNCEGKTPAVSAAEFGRATIFKCRLAQSTRPFTEVELKEALNLATRNKSDYRRVRAEYRKQGVTLGDRSAFKEILAALDRQI
jgi:ankyrin repeat protein